MKKFQIVFIVFLFITLKGFSFESYHFVDPRADSLMISTADSTDYDIIIFDPGFSTWMITHAKPQGYYTKEYYRTKNIMFVAEWNSRVRTSRYSAPYEYEIEYNPSVDYGTDVNYQLYWYFRYMEQNYGISLFGSGLRWR